MKRAELLRRIKSQWFGMRHPDIEGMHRYAVAAAVAAHRAYAEQADRPIEFAGAPDGHPGRYTVRPRKD